MFSCWENYLWSSTNVLFMSQIHGLVCLYSISGETIQSILLISDLFDIGFWGVWLCKLCIGIVSRLMLFSNQRSAGVFLHHPLRQALQKYPCSSHLGYYDCNAHKVHWMLLWTKHFSCEVCDLLWFSEGEVMSTREHAQILWLKLWFVHVIDSNMLQLLLLSVLWTYALAYFVVGSYLPSKLRKANVSVYVFYCLSIISTVYWTWIMWC